MLVEPYYQFTQRKPILIIPDPFLSGKKNVNKWLCAFIFPPAIIIVYFIALILRTILFPVLK